MKKLFYFLPVLLIGGVLFMGQKSPESEKWSVDPRMTNLQPESDYSPFLPTLPKNFVHSTEPRTDGPFLVGPNIRVHPTTNTNQSEVIIVRNPVNPNTMLASGNMTTIGGSLFISEGVYVTTDGGLTWHGNDTLTGAPITNHGGDPGPTIDKDGTMIMTHLGRTTSGMFANYSTDNGMTWSNTYTIASGSQDKNFAGTDDDPASPYYGRSYCVWSYFAVSTPYIAVSYTTNSGLSWSSAQQVNVPPSGHYSQGADVRVGPGGVVYVTWTAPISGSPFTGDFVGFAKSTNGGVNWSVSENIFDINGIRSTSFGTYGIRVADFPRIDVDRSGGPRNGWIYIVVPEKSPGSASDAADIILYKSTNGGTTWSSGTRVNQDTPGNGKLQFFPAIRVDEDGGVNVVYYDNRNTASDSAEVYVARSIDGGTTWSEVLVSDHRFRPRAISGLAGGYSGDYIGITSGNGKLWPVWMDNSTGNYQLWTAYIELGPAILHTPLTNTENVTGPYAINAVINPTGSPIVPAETKVFWSRNGAPITNSLLMTNTGGNNWTASIPGNGSPAEYRYYITTKDQQNRTTTSPPGAPANYHSFIAEPDTSDPQITHTSPGQVPIGDWPVSLSAEVTDNIGVDSVYVKWRKNTGGVLKQFKLNNSGGNSYMGIFNSLQSDVNANDTIYYRIFAIDNSSNHNVDSTSMQTIRFLNKFFVETFPTTTFNTANWATTTAVQIIDVNGVSTSTFPYSVPSAPYFLTVKNTTALLESQPIDIGAFNTGKLIMHESEHDLELGERVHLEYFNSSSSWQSLHIFEGTNNGFGTFEPFDSVSFDLPPNALHSGFKFRYRGEGLESTDEWFFDNICILGNVITELSSNGSQIPERYYLGQNYPNPFNPSTKISFEIPKHTFVSLKIFDITGREVSKLLSREMDAGAYIIDFNAQHLASGIYFYRIDAGEFIQTKRMMFIK